MESSSRPARFALALALAGCGGARFAPSDGGTLPDLATCGARCDGGAPLGDATIAPDLFAGDGPPAWDPSVPHPPAGATLCAQGPFSPADSQKACMAPSLVLDHWGGGQPFPRDCAAVTFDAGDYRVYCDQASAYLFLHFANLRATGTLTCKNQTALILSAVYEAANGGGDTGDNFSDGYGEVPEGFFDPQHAVDAYGWITVGVKDAGATLWLAPLNAQLDPQCGSADSGHRTVVAGLAVAWGQ